MKPSLLFGMIVDLLPVALTIVILLFAYHYAKYLYKEKKQNSLRSQMLREWLDKK